MIQCRGTRETIKTLRLPGTGDKDIWYSLFVVLNNANVGYSSLVLVKRAVGKERSLFPLCIGTQFCVLTSR